MERRKEKDGQAMRETGSRCCRGHGRSMTGARRQGMEMGRSGACTRSLEALTASIPGQVGPTSGSPLPLLTISGLALLQCFPRAGSGKACRCLGFFLHTGFPSAEQGAASPTAILLAFYKISLTLSHRSCIMQTCRSESWIEGGIGEVEPER